MAFIAQRRLEVGTRVVQRGDPIPEAAEFRNLTAYLTLEWIKEVPDPPAPTPKSKSKLASDTASEPATVAGQAAVQPAKQD